MKIVTLTENITHNEHLVAEHGLSLYIETEKHIILFDMGQTDVFSKNAEKLDIDLKNVDIAFLSHGHYDHGGGLEKFLRINDHAKIYVNENAFGDYYNGTEKYIGLDKSLKENPRVVKTGDFFTVDEGLSLFSCNTQKKTESTNSFALNMKLDGVYMPDDFQHEQYLLITENNKEVLISGCSHKGIVNIVDWFNPHVLIGGFHLSKLDPETSDKNRLDEIAASLLKHNIIYYTCHCTGVEQYNYLKTKMRDSIDYLSTGSVIEL